MEAVPYTGSSIRRYAIIHTELKYRHILLESEPMLHDSSKTRDCLSHLVEQSVKSLIETRVVVEQPCGPVAQESCIGPSLRSG